MRLILRLVLRPLWRDPLRTAMTVFAVALGVAVVVATDLAGDAATGSFRSSLETLTGKTDFEILANGGIDEQWIGRLDSLEVNARFEPWIEAQARVSGAGVVPLYGVDMVSAAATVSSGEASKGFVADGVVVTKSLAGRIGAREGGAIEAVVDGVEKRFPVLQVIDAGPTEYLALDLAEAQRVLGRVGRLDRIDVIAGKGQDESQLEDAVRRVLPAGYRIERPGSRSEQNQRMLRAFRWNLRVLSYISLVVGAFLIYNTVAIGVVRRRAEIGILRALGMTRRGVFLLFLGEALALGLAGAAVGLGLGRGLAGLLVGMVSSTVNALFATSRPAPVQLTLAESLVALGAAALVAVFSAFGPAREASEAHPTEAMSRGAREHRSRIRWRRGLGWSAAFAAAAAVAARAKAVDGFPVFGYAAAFLSIAAATALAPGLVVAANRLSRGGAWRRVEVRLAGRSLAGSLGRTSVVVAALATAIAMMASVGIMVGSFRETVVAWLEVQLRADLFVRSAARRGPGEQPPLPEDVPALLRGTPGVAEVGVLHSTELTYRGERAIIGGGDMDVLRRAGGLRFLRGEDRDGILRSLPGRDRAIVSEPFATKFDVQPGDKLTVDVGSRQVTFTVAGIYYDYSSSQGWVIVDRQQLLRYLPDLPAASASVYLVPGADLDKVRGEIERRMAHDNVFVDANRELRRVSMEVFDRTFAITWALEGVAIVVAMLGAANALLAMALDRRRELALLRYLGASRGQVRGMILAEAGWIGLLSAALGLALGTVLSLLLVLVVNKQSFGWSIQFHPPVGLIAAEMALIWVFTVLAGLYPARIAARLDPADAIHEE